MFHQVSVNFADRKVPPPPKTYYNGGIELSGRVKATTGEG